MGDFRKLIVWQKSKDLAVRIYKITNTGVFAKDFRFKDQIRAAAISVPSNIAEGDENKTNKQSVNYFHIAKGSTAEVITQLIIAYEVDYIDKQIHEELINEYNHVSHMLAKLIATRKQTN